MKTNLLTATLLAACTVMVSCDKKNDTVTGGAEKAAEKVADPKAAFKTACDAIAAKVTTATSDFKAGKTKEGLAAMKEAIDGLGKVPLTGLPDAVKTAFESFTKSHTEALTMMGDLPEGMPTDPAKMQEFLKTAGPEVMQKLAALGPKMQALKPAMDASKKALGDAAKEAGLDLSAFLKAGE